MASTTDHIKTAARALIVVLFGLVLAYIAFLALLRGLESSVSVSGGVVLQRPPITLPEAISLVEESRIQLVVIHGIRDDEQFLLLPSPFQPQATPIRQWAGHGYIVDLYGADQADGLVILTPGESTIGLDDLALEQLLQEVGKANQVDPCRVVVLDYRSSTAPVVSPSPPGCPLPTGTATMPLSPEEGLAEGIARPPIPLAEARQMILEGQGEVLRLRSEKYPNGIRRAYRYVEDGNQQLFRVYGVDVLLYDLSRPDSRPVTNSSTTVGLNEAGLQSLLGAVREAKSNGNDTQVIDERN